MRFVPDAVSRKFAGQVLLARKHSPTILFGVGIASMVGSTVLACRATLKLEDVLDRMEDDKADAHLAKAKVDSGELPEDVTYTEDEMGRDLMLISVRGVVSITKLYAPAIIVGGVGVVCLTRSHQILMERNAAITAAYVLLDRAFKNYRERVIDRYGEETDRDLRYDYEQVEVIDEKTGKISQQYQIAEGEQGLYSRWFDRENPNWTDPPNTEYNWIWLRNQQNWANDRLRARGHLILNEVYHMIGLSDTSAGAVVGWIYDRDNPIGDNVVDFGC